MGDCEHVDMLDELLADAFREVAFDEQAQQRILDCLKSQDSGRNRPNGRRKPQAIAAAIAACLALSCIGLSVVEKGGTGAQDALLAPMDAAGVHMYANRGGGVIADTRRMPDVSGAREWSSGAILTEGGLALGFELDGALRPVPAMNVPAGIREQGTIRWGNQAVESCTCIKLGKTQDRYAVSIDGMSGWWVAVPVR